MTLSLRQRILLTVTPLFLLLVGFGTVGLVLLGRLGQRSDAILRENYDSVRAMTRLKLAALQNDWPEVETQFQIEKNNITILPEEPKLVEALGDAIRRGRNDDVQRLADAIHDLNENQMRIASRKAQDTAFDSVAVFLIGLAFAVAFAVLALWWLQRTLLEPIRAITDAASAIGEGQLHQVIPVQTRDEVGLLAMAFNGMAAKLRDYRQTDTERLLRARQTGQATIDSFPDPVLVVDTLGCIELANPSAQRLLGVVPPRDGEPRLPWTPPESLRRPLEDAVRQQRANLAESFDQAVTFRLDGNERIYLPQWRPIRAPDGEPLGAALVLNDVTRFRLLDRLKSDWVATVSHELKTPLTGVRLAVHVLLEEVVGPLESKQVELLVEARENTERLLKLIEHLLSLARLEDGREELQLAATDPLALVRAAVEKIETRADDKRIEVSVVDERTNLLETTVMVDALRMELVLNNLLDNALTYTEPGGRVSLSVSATPASVCLTIRDSGIGIPQEYLPHVFERFFRVPEALRQRDEPGGSTRSVGTGLGLAIVREIVLAHGGDVTCDSKLGEGTTFRISLPLHEPAGLSHRDKPRGASTEDFE